MQTLPASSLRIALLLTGLSATLLLPACSEKPAPPADAATDSTAAATAPAAVETKIEHLDAAAAAALLAAPPADNGAAVTVLDVRTPEEFSVGHIEGAVNVDFQGDDFAKALEPLDKSKTYVVHCLSGGRSSASLPAFQKAGFKHIIHLDGGMKGWRDAGLPVAK